MRYADARALKALAAAIEREDAARTYLGTTCPDEIRFFRRDGDESTTTGDNPVLLDAIKAEIRRSWDDIRQAAFDHLRASVEAGAAEVAALDAVRSATPVPLASGGPGR